MKLSAASWWSEKVKLADMEVPDTSIWCFVTNPVRTAIEIGSGMVAAIAYRMMKRRVEGLCDEMVLLPRWHPGLQ